MGKRDFRINEAIIDTIKSALLTDPVFVQSVLRYTGDFTFDNPRDIPDLQTIQSFVGDGSFSYQQFDASDIEVDVNGNYIVAFDVVGENVPFAIRIETPSKTKNMLPNWENGVLYGFDDTSVEPTQTITVFYTTVNVTPPPAPSIPVFTISPPSSANVITGNSLTITVSATNSPIYQWNFNGSPIPGENSPTLTINGFSSVNNGAYTCTAYNGGGSVTSSACNALAIVPAAGSIIINNRSSYLSRYSDGGVAYVDLSAGNFITDNSFSYYNVDFPQFTTIKVDNYNSAGDLVSTFEQYNPSFTWLTQYVGSSPSFGYLVTIRNT